MYAAVKGSRSAIEHEPAYLIAQPLVVEYKLTDLAGKLCTLPLALQMTSLVTLVFRNCRPCGPNRVSRRAQLVSCHMTNRPGLSGGVSRFLRGAGRLSCRGVGVKGVIASLSPRDPTPCPGSRLFDRPARTVVSRSHLLEEGKYMLCAISSPYCKKMMIGVRQGATPTHSNKPGVSLLGEDHILPKMRISSYSLTFPSKSVNILQWPGSPSATGVTSVQEKHDESITGSGSRSVNC